MNKERWVSGGIGAVAGFVLAAVIFLIVPRIDFKPNPGPGPGPAPSGVKGDVLVVIVDETSPTLEEGAILDGGLADALRTAAKLQIRSNKWPALQAKNYATLVQEAGGTPAALVLTKAGDKVAAKKLPTDEAAFSAFVHAYVNDPPPPLALATPQKVVNQGEELKVEQGDGVPYVDVGGHKRFLTAKPPHPQVRALLPRYGDSHPTFPECKWRDINRRNVFTWDVWGLDQNGHGSCVGQANSAALAKARVQQGMDPVKLSPVFLYAQINGGRDQGAIISDAPAALQKTGTCSFALVGQSPIYWSQMPAKAKEEAKRFKAADWYRCDTWEELGSALQTGLYFPVFGVQVGNSWGRFDKYGVCGHDRGPGNHALHADGMKKLEDGRWVLDTVNSWGEWGPWNNGRCYLDKNHLFANGDMPDVCVYRAATDDPQDPRDPPVYTGKVAK